MSLQLSVSEEDLKDKYANKLEPHMVGAEHEVGGEGGGGFGGFGGLWWFLGVLVVLRGFGGFWGSFGGFGGGAIG